MSGSGDVDLEWTQSDALLSADEGGGSRAVISRCSSDVRTEDESEEGDEEASGERRGGRRRTRRPGAQALGLEP